jgi:hypothetical protein
MKKFYDMQKYNASINRIALHSFLLFSGNISNIIWPDVREKTVEPTKSRRQKRKDHLEKFFPSADYPNLKNKLFRLSLSPIVFTRIYFKREIYQ